MPQCTKSSVKFEGGNVMVFGMISAAGTGPLIRLHGKINATVYKEILKKHVVTNLRTAINQPAICKITLHVTQQSLLRHFFLRRMFLLWGGLVYNARAGEEPV